jgi:hypothetical protein
VSHTQFAFVCSEISSFVIGPDLDSRMGVARLVRHIMLDPMIKSPTPIYRNESGRWRIAGVCEEGNFGTMPEALLVKILIRLPRAQLLACMAACKHWYRAARPVTLLWAWYVVISTMLPFCTIV